MRDYGCREFAKIQKKRQEEIFFFLHYNRKFQFDLYDLHMKSERRKEDI